MNALNIINLIVFWFAVVSCGFVVLASPSWEKFACCMLYWQLENIRFLLFMLWSRNSKVR